MATNVNWKRWVETQQALAGLEFNTYGLDDKLTKNKHSFRIMLANQGLVEDMG